jgi:hypothetical protein
MAGFMDVLFPAATATAGALSNRAQKSTTTSTRSYGPNTKNLVDQMLAKYSGLLSSGPGGYMATGINNINRAADLQKMAQENIVAARGIQGNAAAAPLLNTENERFRNVIDFQNKAPLDYLSQITQGLSSLPMDTTETSTQEIGGNKLGGGATGFAAALAQMFGQGVGGGGKALDFGSITNGLHFLTGLGGKSMPPGFEGPIKPGATLPGLIKGGFGKLGTLAAAHPLAAVGIGAGVGAALLAKHFVGQGRRAANVLTGEGGLQHSFEQALNEIDSMQVDDNTKNQYKKEAYDELVKQGLEHAKGGSNQAKVVAQMFDTISPLFGQQNPLKPQMNAAQQMMQKFTGAA